MLCEFFKISVKEFATNILNLMQCMFSFIKGACIKWDVKIGKDELFYRYIIC